MTKQTADIDVHIYVYLMQTHSPLSLFSVHRLALISIIWLSNSFMILYIVQKFDVFKSYVNADFKNLKKKSYFVIIQFIIRFFYYFTPMMARLNFI